MQPQSVCQPAALIGPPVGFKAAAAVGHGGADRLHLALRPRHRDREEVLLRAGCIIGDPAANSSRRRSLRGKGGGWREDAGGFWVFGDI